MNSILRAGTIVLSLALATGALAQPFPTKPVRIVVPFSAGSGSDVFARTLGPRSR